MVEALLPHLELLHSMTHFGGTSAAALAQQLLLLDIIGFLLELSPSCVLAASQPSSAWLLGVYTSMLRWALQTSVSCRVLQLCASLQASCLHLLGTHLQECCQASTLYRMGSATSCTLSCTGCLPAGHA